MFEKLWTLAHKKDSRLIVAIDEDKALDNIPNLLNDLREHAIGIKLGFPALFKLGIEGIRSMIRSWRNEFYFLADYKLADIPYIVNLALLKLRVMGFDGATVHVFQRGLEEALKGEVPEAVGVISMSHKSLLLDKEFVGNLQYAKGLGMKGLVIGATKKEFIRKGKEEGFVIFSPGIGAQGGRVGEALRLGTNFEIIGRAIINAEDPKKAAEKVVKIERRVLSSL